MPRALEPSPCVVVTEPPVPFKMPVIMTMTSGNAWNAVVDKRRVLKCSVSSDLRSNVDAIETDAVTCALLSRLVATAGLRSCADSFMTCHGTFVAPVRQDGRTAVLLPSPEPGSRYGKCVVAGLVPGKSLYASLRGARGGDLRNLVNSLSHTLAAMLQVGYTTGFVHNDSHIGNLLYDPSSRTFVLIDYGKCSFDPGRLEKVLGKSAISRIVHRECCNLGVKNPPTRLEDFYARYKGFEQKFPVTSRGRRATRRFAIMHDIACIAFMTWFLASRGPRRSESAIDLSLHGLISFSTRESSLTIPSHPADIVACAKTLRGSTSVFAPIAAGLAWMAMYLVSFFESVGRIGRAHGHAIRVPILDALGQDHRRYPLFSSGVMTRYGIDASEDAMNKNLGVSNFVAELLTKQVRVRGAVTKRPMPRPRPRR